MQRYRLDDIDEALLALLRADGRTPFAELAHSVGLSPDAARARYTRLTNDGVLRVIGVVHPRSLGYRSLANVWLTYRGPMEDLVKAAADVPNVTFMTQVLAEQNVLCEIVAADDTEIADIVHSTFMSLPDVSNLEICKCLETIKWESQARPAPAPGLAPGDEPAALSEVDGALLRLLVENPRMSYRDLAAALGEPYWIVRKRTQTLFAQGTIRATAMVDRVSTEPQIMATIVVRIGAGGDAALRAIGALPEVALLNVQSGSYHATAEVSCDSSAALARLGRQISDIAGILGMEIRPYVRTLIVPMPWSLDARTDW
ncbi:MAG: Lrp/AsnC family transcriptional regulator [Pseudonocardiales bacterium]|nr:Lrp/AsnC family transcriptional regulator [Pseudonocardiales bacterium]